MYIVFRCDSSTAIGTGHLLRCLALARELRSRHYDAIFVCRDALGSQHGLVELNSFRLILLARSDRPSMSEMDDARETMQALAAINQRAAWVICDSYSIGRVWEEAIKEVCVKVMVIDDLADKLHHCDVLVNSNFNLEMKQIYSRITNTECRLLLGPEFCFIRKQFHEAFPFRKTYLDKANSERLNVHVFLGGVDLFNETQKILKISDDVSTRCQFKVILGAANPHKRDINQYSEGRSNISILESPKNYELGLATCDIAIGAGGTSTWERFYFGIPTISVSIADNQEPVNQALAQEGYCLYLGRSESVLPSHYLSALEVLVKSPELRWFLSVRPQKLVDGRGLERIADILAEELR